jgi:predicted RNase H-like HicB family nuclease
MTRLAEHRGYVGVVETDDGAFLGRVAGLPDVVTLEGYSYASAITDSNNERRHFPYP